MKVKDFRLYLDKYKDDCDIYLSVDEEGNSVKPVIGLTMEALNHGDEFVCEGDEWSRPVVVIWP